MSREDGDPDVLHTLLQPKAVLPEFAPAGPAPNDSPLCSSPSHTPLRTCPTCSSVFSDHQAKEFRDHVAECTRRGTPDSDSSLSSLSSRDHVRPLIGPARDARRSALSDAQNQRTSYKASPQTEEHHSSQSSSHNLGPDSRVIESSDANREIPPSSRAHSSSHTDQTVIREDSDDDDLSHAGDDSADYHITPYIKPIEYEYEYYDDVEFLHAPAVEAIASEAAEGSSTASQNSPNLEAITDERHLPDVETPSLEQPDPFQIEPALSRKDSGMSATPSSPGGPNHTNGLNTVDSSVIGTPGPSQKQQDITSSAPSIPFSSFPPISSQPAMIHAHKPNQKRLAFKKLSSLDNFEKYLANPEDMSYEVLYHRTSRVTDSLVEWQAEYDEIDAELKAFELQRRTHKKLADEVVKEAREKQQKADDKQLLALHRQYSKELKFTGPEWRNYVSENWSSFKNAEQQKEFDLLKTLRNAATIAAVLKRQAQAQKKAESQPEYANLLLPKLTKDDTESHVFKRKLVIDPRVFDDKKQADVLAFTWSKETSHIGHQRPKVRRGEDPFATGNAKGSGGPFQENGRPQRTRNKRAMYDTDQADDAADEERGELPPKRRRTQRTLNSGSADASAEPSREPTPAVKTFASGKRIGRPPGSKTKPKVVKSKMQSVQVPPETDDSDAEPPVGTKLASKKVKQALGPNEEAQLQDAAESLVNKTMADRTSPEVKHKHPGGRPKKHNVRMLPGNMVTGPPPGPEALLVAANARNKTGRPKKGVLPEGQLVITFDKPKAAKAGKARKETVGRKIQVQQEEDYDVLPSTEPDDESPFTSTSTSRPSSSSSGASMSSLGARRGTRGIRGKSKIGDDNLGGEMQVKKGRSRKRKHATEGPQNNVADDAYPLDPAGQASKRRKARTEKSQSSLQTATTENSQAMTEASTTGRPKRKRAAGSYVEVETEDLDIEEDGSTPPPPKKRRPRTKKAAVKGKAIKRGDTSDDGEVFEDEPETSVPPPASKRPPRKAAPKTLKLDFDDSSTGEEEEDRVQGSVRPILSEGTTPATSAKKARAKSRAKSVTHTDEVHPEYPTTEGDVAILDDKEAEIARKKAQKSAKLSASAKRRWESGQMVGPMQKRKATNDAKKAARAAAKANAAVQGRGSAPPQQIAPAPVSMALEMQPVPSASMSTTPGLASIRSSGRARKPSRLAMGMDGAFDDDGDDDDDDNAEGEDGVHFKSEYEQFRALSSPKDPIVLGKRVRRSIYDLSTLNDDDDDDDVDNVKDEWERGDGGDRNLEV